MVEPGTQAGRSRSKPPHGLQSSCKLNLTPSQFLRVVYASRTFCLEGSGFGDSSVYSQAQSALQAAVARLPKEKAREVGIWMYPPPDMEAPRKTYWKTWFHLRRPMLLGGRVVCQIQSGARFGLGILVHTRSMVGLPVDRLSWPVVCSNHLASKLGLPGSCTDTNTRTHRHTIVSTWRWKMLNLVWCKDLARLASATLRLV